MAATFWLLLFVALAVTLLVGQWLVGSAVAGRRIRRILEQGEVVLLKAEGAATRFPQTLPLLSVWRLMPLAGSLYLTNRRLLWRRHLLGYLGPALSTISLGAIDECYVKRIGPFGSVQIKARSELLTFHPYRHRLSPTRVVNRGFAEHMARAINEARVIVQRASS